MTPWASGDICRHLNIDRSTLRYFRHNHGFPQPKWHVSTGELWDRAEVLTWRKDRASRRKTRYMDGLLHYRSMAKAGIPSVVASAAVADVHPDTFRAYLKEVGEPLPTEHRAR